MDIHIIKQLERKQKKKWFKELKGINQLRLLRAGEQSTKFIKT